MGDQKEQAVTEDFEIVIIKRSIRIKICFGEAYNIKFVKRIILI